MITQYVSLEHQKYNVIILAGGHGSRMGQQSDFIPKALTQIGNQRAIDYLIEQFKGIAHKFVIGTCTHADLLEAHLASDNLPLEFSRENRLVNNATSLLYALDHVDSRYPTLLHYCDIIMLGDPVVKPDTFYIVDDNTKGRPSTYRAGIEHGNVVLYNPAQKHGMAPVWTFGNTIKLKKIAYSQFDNLPPEDAIDIIRAYSNEQFMQINRIKMCLEFGTLIDLEETRKLWQNL